MFFIIILTVENIFICLCLKREMEIGKKLEYMYIRKK